MNDLIVKEASYLAQYQNEGVSDINREDVSIPYVKLIQKMSEEIGQDGIAYGDMINSITKEKLGKEVKFVPVKLFTNYRIFEKGKLIDSSEDGITWTSGNKIPTADIWKYKQFNVYALINGSPYLICFKSTSYGAGKQLVGMMAQFSKLPIFAKTYSLSAVEESNDMGSYMVFKVKCMIGFTDEETCKVAAEMRSFINSVDLKNKVADLF